MSSAGSQGEEEVLTSAGGRYEFRDSRYRYKH